MREPAEQDGRARRGQVEGVSRGYLDWTSITVEETDFFTSVLVSDSEVRGGMGWVSAWKMMEDEGPATGQPARERAIARRVFTIPFAAG